MIDTGLEIGTKVFELTGARASATRAASGSPAHSLHEPVAYKRREVGAYALLNELSAPTWYT